MIAFAMKNLLNDELELDVHERAGCMFSELSECSHDQLVFQFLQHQKNPKLKERGWKSNECLRFL